VERKRVVVGIAAAGGLLVVGFVLVLALVPVLFKDRIVAFLNEQIDEQVAADVALGDVSVSLLSTFPRLGVRVHDVKVVNQAPFAGTELFSAGEIVLGLDVMSVIRGEEIRIHRIGLVDPAIHVIVDEEGRTNTDIVRAGEEGAAPAPEPAGEEGAGYALRLDDLDVQNLRLVYDDRSGGMKASVDDLDVAARVSFEGDVAKVQSTSSIAALGFATGGVTMLRDAALDAEIDLVYDTATGKAEFGDNTIAINAMPLSFAGTVWPKEDATELALTFQTADNSFKSLLSLVPAAYGESFAGLDAAGTIAVGGKVEGTYASTDDTTTLPAFDVAVAVHEGRFKYPDLPTGVDRVELDLQLRHPGGTDLDALVIDVPKLGLTAAGAPFDAQLRLTHPMSDPDLTAKAKGVVDLAALRAAMPAEAEAAPPSGRIELDLAVAGRMSDFQAGDAEGVQAEGTVVATDVRYVSEGWPELLVKKLDLVLGTEVAELRQAKVSWDDSAVTVAGRVEGILPYLMTDDGVLRGNVSVNSPKMDLRPFEGEGESGDAAAPAPAAGKAGKKGKGNGAATGSEGSGGEGEPALVAVPTNVDFVTELKIDRLITSSFDMSDVVGSVIVRDGAVRMDPLKATMLGGRVTLEGGYAAPTARKADLDVAITGFELQIDDTLQTFETMAAILPVLEGVAGRYDTSFSMKLALQDDGTPDLASLASSGMFAPMGATLRPGALDEVAKKLGGGFDALQLSGARVNYSFDNGKIDVEPFTVKLGGNAAELSGQVGVLDRKLDLVADLSVPTKLLAGAPALASVKKALGSSVDVAVRFRGTYDAPKVSVAVEGAGDVVDAVVGEVKEQVGKVLDDVIAEARRQGDALVAAAEREADRLRSEAKKAADKLRSEGKKQGDKLVKDAKGNPLKEVAAKEAAKVVEREAGKAADKVVKEADTVANKVVSEAKSQRDKLIREAEAKAKAATK
jgi:uncharacterized protein involved in outer membrane biogenesis/uncharacterized protein YjbJ (UPF0337 family)